MSDTHRINITETMANVFGCHDDADIIDKLCQISDLAANIRISLVDGDLATAADAMNLTISDFEWTFVKWETS